MTKVSLCALCVLCVSLVSASSLASASSTPVLLQLQVWLDRAGFSPGEIDGRDGPNTRRATQRYAKARGLADDGHATVLQKLSEEHANAPAVADYTITAGDVAGPFAPDIPGDLVQQAALPALGYRTPLEALAEKFHASPALLQRLNTAAKFVAGERIAVPNVNLDAGADRPVGTAGTTPASVVVRVSKRTSAVEVVAPDGSVVFSAPVTSGSEFDSLPIGEWKVTGIARNPAFHYNPDLFWDADPSHAKATIKPGPNNPVGSVWIDISKPHYGLHGSPEPSRIGKTESHGCVRMTNWDARRAAEWAKPGMLVVFQ
ncbi:MAG: L,D-transpeptidase family protein [Steroidobacteraceae bacterium]